MPDECSLHEAKANLPTLSERLAQLEARGAISRVKREPGDEGAFTIGLRKSGGLQHFLDDRD